MAFQWKRIVGEYYLLAFSVVKKNIIADDYHVNPNIPKAWTIKKSY